MKNFVQDGKTLNYTNAGSAIVAGDVVIAGKIVGIAQNDIAASTGTGVLATKGVFKVAKTTALVVAQGDELFWNTGTKKVTKTVTDTPIGTAWEAQINGDTTVLVKLVGGGGNGVPEAATVAAVAGTLTGTVTGTIVNVAAAATAGGATPTAAQVDTAVAALSLSTNLALKELQTTLNAALAALKAAGLMA